MRKIWLVSVNKIIRLFFHFKSFLIFSVKFSFYIVNLLVHGNYLLFHFCNSCSLIFELSNNFLKLILKFKRLYFIFIFIPNYFSVNTLFDSFNVVFELAIISFSLQTNINNLSGGLILKFSNFWKQTSQSSFYLLTFLPNELKFVHKGVKNLIQLWFLKRTNNLCGNNFEERFYHLVR